MIRNIFTISNIATIVTGLWLYTSIKSLYGIMYPLSDIDMSVYPESQLVQPYWERNEKEEDALMDMKVYLSTGPEFNSDFLIDEYTDKYRRSKVEAQDGERDLPPKRNRNHDSILLWEESGISTSSSFLSKSVILATKEKADDGDNFDPSCSAGTGTCTATDVSFDFASKWLREAEEKARALDGDGSEGGGGGGGGILDVLSSASAGEGIESTSILLSLYKGISKTVSSLFYPSSDMDKDNVSSSSSSSSSSAPVTVPISKASPIWKNLMTNSTVHIHVILIRNIFNDNSNANSDSFQRAVRYIQQSSQTNNALLGNVDMVKYDTPHHIHKPSRYLYKDVSYLVRKHILRTVSDEEVEPWIMSQVKPDEYRVYQTSLEMKQNGIGYPYWKPEVTVKLVSDTEPYPVDYVGYSGMAIVQIDRNIKRAAQHFPSGYAYLPGLYVDEIGLTSEKYIPLNQTVTALPLRISFDRNTPSSSSSSEVTDRGLSPARWRLLTHLSKALDSQKEMGFEQSDIDDIRRLIADTNVTLLAITVLASTLHMLFEFLTFKNEVEFWKGNKDLTGLSVRALFMDFFSQVIILLFLVEKDSSLLMTIPSACGCLIALWKCQRGAGFQFVKITKKDGDKVAVWNKVFRVVGYELQATRLRAAAATRNKRQNADKANSTPSSSSNQAKQIDLGALTEEMDSLATRTLGKYFLLPLVFTYTLHTLINEEHPGWYSWLITSASSAVYALGFVLMTPQLFLNYKLKSVAHLPWRVLCYRFINTFIDDLFAFIIRMPTMARISCFRDDVIFIIYLGQRYLYPVDTSRPVEGGGMDAVSAAASTAAVDSTMQQNDKKNNDESKKKR